jgi:O-antigen/teichoic acid export membrane protein
MTRTHKAAVLAAFTYVQFALAIVTGILLVPLILRYLGARTYGLWLTTGELLAYASMIELGVLGVLPWMIAEVDGTDNREGMRRLVSNGLTVGCLVGALFVVAAMALWQLVPSVLRLSPADRAVVGWPLVVMVAAIALTYPLRVYRAVLAGLQDVVFNGALGIVEASITAGVTLVMLMKGYGIYALACAAAAASIFGTLAGTVRAALVAPDLFWQWERPSVTDLRVLLGHGIGAWFGTFGWQIIAASNSIVITYIGHPEWVPVYFCTYKLSGLLTQLGWVLPDSGLIGLAQLQGERPGSERLAQRVGALLQLHLLLAGGSACIVLALNPAFVTRWVGESFFAGSSINGILAAGIVLSSVVHGCMTVSAVLGRRMIVGMATLVNAGLQVVCAVVLGHRLGLLGVAAAALLSAAMTTLPAGIVLLRSLAAVTVHDFVASAVKPWLRRIAPLAAVAALVGIFHDRIGVELAAFVSAALGVTYLWRMRHLYHILPLDPRWVRWLVSVKLLPPLPAPAPMEQS